METALCCSFSRLCWAAGTHTTHHYLNFFLALCQDSSTTLSGENWGDVQRRSGCSALLSLSVSETINQQHTAQSSTYNGHVGQREVLRLPPDLNRERGFKGRLVEAREGHPRRRRLELRCCKHSKWGEKRVLVTHLHMHGIHPFSVKTVNFKFTK